MIELVKKSQNSYDILIKANRSFIGQFYREASGEFIFAPSRELAAVSLNLMQELSDQLGELNRLR